MGGKTEKKGNTAASVPSSSTFRYCYNVLENELDWLSFDLVEYFENERVESGDAICEITTCNNG